MDMQTFHPVFESGQVLTSALLNDIIGFLEPQDRATRAALSGIGIVCGLRPDWNDEAGTLTLSRGIAVTSNGHLIVEEEAAFKSVRPYILPHSSAADPAARTPEERYQFLFDGETQHELFELLPIDFQPLASSAATSALSSELVADKTVLLFVETTIEALKNCDTNDCADKGGRRRVGLRRLLVRRDIADRILRQEAEIAGRPVDRANHPRLGLPFAKMEKVNVAAHAIGNANTLYRRYLDCIVPAAFALTKSLQAAWETYRAMLTPLYPPAQFPHGPIPPHFFLNLFAALAHAPVQLQYVYAAIHDMTLAYNEFVSCAARFDTECAPRLARFPRHVLAGDVVTRPTAFAKAPRSWDEYLHYDARAARTGPSPEGMPAARRHHFLPSPANSAGNDRIAELRSLFSRLVLLAQTFATRNLLSAGIELTPSRDGDASLGERAIPFYYQFDSDSDLFANWSWRKARSLRFDTIHSWQFSAAVQPHPLLTRHDGEDFIRIEGVLGKPLGTAMATLISAKRRLGVSFSLQPVWIAIGRESHTRFRRLAIAAMRQLLSCRLPNLDVNFRASMAETFSSVAEIVERLGRLDATRATQRGAVAAASSASTEQARRKFEELIVTDGHLE